MICIIYHWFFPIPLLENALELLSLDILGPHRFKTGNCKGRPCYSSMAAFFEMGKPNPPMSIPGREISCPYEVIIKGQSSTWASLRPLDMFLFKVDFSLRIFHPLRLGFITIKNIMKNPPNWGGHMTLGIPSPCFRKPSFGRS